MKPTRLALALVVAAGTQPALAFHEGGVGECEGCHSMHGKQDGTKAGAFLLVGSDASSACLSCHASTTQGTYQVFTSKNVPQIPPAQLTPGGDFGWLKKSYHWSKGGGNGRPQGSGEPGGTPRSQRGRLRFRVSAGLRQPESPRRRLSGRKLKLHQLS